MTTNKSKAAAIMVKEFNRRGIVVSRNNLKIKEVVTVINDADQSETIKRIDGELIKPGTDRFTGFYFYNDTKQLQIIPSITEVLSDNS